MRNRVSKHNGKIHVDLSAGQQTELGIMVGHIYYYNDTLMALCPHSSGYPHNGGEHTMRIAGSKGDIQAFLQMTADHYRENPLKWGGNLVDVQPELKSIMAQVEAV